MQPLSEIKDLEIPLVFDLDGTLIKADALHENFVDALFHKPGRLLRHIPSFFAGRAAIKRTLSLVKALDPSALPYRQEILDLAASARNEGRNVYLVTAADQSIADSVAGHLGVFTGAKGSDGQINLKGKNKLEWLKTLFPQGFIYVGDGAADLPIWENARRAILVGKGVRYADRLCRANIEVEIITQEQRKPFQDWMAELRIHQWTKNLLIFVPLVLGHLVGDPAAVLKTVIAFFAFGMVASATYIINDIADLKSDRAHATKKFRAIASGRIGVVEALVVSLILSITGLWIAFALRPAFSVVVLCYLALTLAYSFRLKRFPLLDVATIGTLFTLRVVMGTALHASLVYSPWLISFSACIFFSLALAKRHVEVMRARERGLETLWGRGYGPSDWPVTLGYGVASANVSILIMLLFIALEAGESGGYSYPAWLYAAPGGVFLWTQRIWILSHRMQLHDDPIVFALKDRVSYLIGALVAVGFILAL